MNLDRVEVLDVGVDVVTEQDVLDFVRRRVESRQPARIVTVNAEFVMMARDHAEFRAVLNGATVATADGAGILWALRRLGVDLRQRVGGSDLIWSMSRQAAQQGHRVFFLGAGTGVAAATSEVLVRRFPGLCVAGTYGGSSDPIEEAYIVDLIRRAQADILFVAFGAPRQDIWIARNLETLGVSIAIGVGGSFDYVAGRARRAPRWMRDRGLEWLWRLIQQPWRWRRMLALPRFVWLVLTEKSRSPDERTRV